MGGGRIPLRNHSAEVTFCSPTGTVQIVLLFGEERQHRGTVSKKWGGLSFASGPVFTLAGPVHSPSTPLWLPPSVLHLTYIYQITSIIIGLQTENSAVINRGAAPQLKSAECSVCNPIVIEV